MYISIRDAIITWAGFPSILEGLKELGLSSVELYIDRNYRAAGLEPQQSFNLKDELQTFKRQLEEHQIKVCAFLLNNDFNAKDLQKEIDWVAEVVRAAEKLSISAVRIDSAMSGESELGFDERCKRFSDCIAAVLKATEDSNVALAIENHGHQGNDPNFIDAVIEKLGSPQRLGLTLDVGNFYWSGKPLSQVYDLLKKYAPIVKHTHIKNIAYPEQLRQKARQAGYKYEEYVATLPTGDIDYKIVVEELRRAGYRGDLTIEDEALGKFEERQRRQILYEDVKYLKELL